MSRTIFAIPLAAALTAGCAPGAMAQANFAIDARVRYERFDNNAFGAAPRPDEGYFQFAALPRAELQVASSLRLFGELQAAWSTRSSATITPFNDQTGLDVAQAFADIGEGAWTLRAGRQVVGYGSERLIVRSGNLLQMFDGARLRRETPGGWRVDAAALRPVELGLRSFDDRADRSRKLWLAYATRAPLDLYYIGYENAAAQFDQGSGAERRHTFGARFFGRRGPWEWDTEAMAQTGAFAGAAIHAGTLATAARYFLASTQYIGLRANVVSGDRDRADPRLNTFNALFPTGQFFGDIAQIGPANLVNLRPSFGAALGNDWQLDAALAFYWRQSLGDSAYDAQLVPLRPGAESRARYIGTQGDIVVARRLERHVALRFVYSRLVPGAFIRETGPAQTVHYLQASVLFSH
jgi:hypothetical protein